LKVYNIVDQRLDFDYRSQYISEELHRGAMRRATALPGDVLMNIVGPPLGKVAVVTDQFAEWSINQALTLFRPSDRVSTGWLYVFLRSGVSVREVLNETRGSVGQVNISLSQCRAFEVPVPTPEEQEEVERRVASLLVVAGRVVQRIAHAEARIMGTSQAALAKAFRGELTTANGVG
jgi:type I restriction enzyme S subunit